MQSTARVASGTSPALKSALKNNRCQGLREVSSAARKVMVQIRAACCVAKAGLGKRERAEE